MALVKTGVLTSKSQLKGSYATSLHQSPLEIKSLIIIISHSHQGSLTSENGHYKQCASWHLYTYTYTYTVAQWVIDLQKKSH